jgi:hypothetical protein
MIACAQGGYDHEMLLFCHRLYGGHVVQKQDLPRG